MHVCLAQLQRHGLISPNENYRLAEFLLNYLAHAYLVLQDPYFVAGTALPDWMNIIDRKNRPRRQFAEPVVTHPDSRIAAMAQGCLRHHDDDRWFHQTQSFAELSTRFAVELRELLDSGLGHQAGLVGHIGVELLLDAILVERHPRLLDAYYAQLRALDFDVTQKAANAICRRPVTRMAELLPRFIESRFLADYHSDRLMLQRLNAVMRRIKLPELPDAVCPWLGSARGRVRDAADRLLTPPDIL